MADALSRRCQNIAIDDCSVDYILESLKNPFHADTNSDGFINMGTAVNGLTTDLVQKKLQDEHIFNLAYNSCSVKERYNMYDYFQELGIERLQTAAASFLNKFFNVAKPVNPNNICFGTGALSCLDVLAHFIGDPGDLVMCVTPQYPMIEKILQNRALLEMWPIPLTSENDYKLQLQDVVQSYDKAANEGKRVCALMLLNPGNPIGQIFSEDLISDIMNFCARRKMHLVMDELYANSIHHNKQKFRSILSYENIPDPDRTHMLYGISKDFSLTKFRVGFVHTFNKGIQNAWTTIAPCQAIAYPIMIVTARLLEDLEWCAKLLEESTNRLSMSFKFVSEKLTEMNIEHLQTEAGFFIWANFSKYCQPLSLESETKFFQELVDDCGIYMVPSNIFRSPELGWFRVLFTKPFEELKEGLRRIDQLLKKKDSL